MKLIKLAKAYDDNFPLAINCLRKTLEFKMNPNPIPKMYETMKEMM